MTPAAQLLRELVFAGVAVAIAPDDPTSLDLDGATQALTPERLNRVKAHKPELLAMLRGDPNLPPAESPDATAVWLAALDRLEGDPLFPPDVMAALRVADVHWRDDESADDDKFAELIDPPDPCPDCRSLELWQTLAGNWRCLRCDPPSKSRRLLERHSVIVR